MFAKVPVGDDIYVWTRGGVKKNVNTACVISAHGGQSIINSTFNIERNTNFVFFGPHGYTLLDPSLMDVLCAKVKPYQTVSMGQCQDYTLSKFQGAKHGGNNEKYSDIEAAGASDDELKVFGFTQQQLDSRPDKPRADLDVVTIRYRRFRTDPTLSGVVKALKKHGWTYTTFYCSFCRGPSLPWKKETGSWDPKTRNL